jgi:external thioesterase TEII
VIVQNWFKDSDKINKAKRQLFLFHFAGGSCYSFEFMRPLLEDFDIIALELPGRGNRIKENLIKDFEEAASDFLNQVLKVLRGSNFVFYGHSLGALFAFKVCQLLEEQNLFPSYIVVSGNAGPGITFKNLNELEKDDFVSELKKLGGIPDEVIEHPDLLDFFVPILKSDFEIADCKSLKITGIIKTPIYAIMGNKEESSTEIENWETFTSSIFKFKVLDGNHFFIYEHVAKVVEAIKFFN